MRARSSLSILVAAAVLLALPTPARAEWFADFYAGLGFTQKQDIDAEFPDVGISLTVRDVQFDDAALIGGRGGYWLEALPFLGFGLSISHVFGPTVGSQTRGFTACASGVCASGSLDQREIDLNVTTVGFDVMARLPLLKSQPFPKGQLQPYLTGGPALFAARAEDHGNVSPSGQSDSDTSIGVKVGAGLTWLFSHNVGVFAEYRFTHFKPEFEFTDNVAGKATVEATLNTHSLLGGVAFRF